MSEVHETKTYISLPPPPLPEFYTSRGARKVATTAAKSTTTSEDKADHEILVTKQMSISIGGTYDYEPRASKKEPQAAPPIPFVAMPAPPPIMCPNPPPLAIYHVCRICLRPRSPRYHRENPIPLDNTPPPSGICRRCRVTAVEDSKDCDLVYESRSHPVKLGFFTPFMKDVVSPGEMKKVKVNQHMSGKRNDREIFERCDIVQDKCESGPQERVKTTTKIRASSHSRGDITYRHIEVVDERSTKEEGAEVDVESRNVIYRSSQEAVDAQSDPLPPAKASKPKTRGTSMQVERTAQPLCRVPNSTTRSDTHINVTVQQKSASRSTTASSSSAYPSESSSSSTARATPKDKKELTGIVEKEVRRIAREELDRYAPTFQQPQTTESDIRRIAKDEVGRYRAVERKMEAHGEPYAHGRLIPVVPEERRIDTERDTPADMPWSLPEKEDTAQVSVSARGSTRRASMPWSEPKKVEVDASIRSKTSARKADAEQPSGPPSVHSVGSTKVKTKSSTLEITDKDDAHGWKEDVTWGFEHADPARVKDSKKPSSGRRALSPIAEQHDGTASIDCSIADEEDQAWGSRWRRDISIQRRRSRAVPENRERFHDKSVQGDEQARQPRSKKSRESDNEAQNDGQRVSRSVHHSSNYGKVIDIDYIRYRERNPTINPSSEASEPPAGEETSSHGPKREDSQRGRGTVCTVVTTSSGHSPERRITSSRQLVDSPMDSIKTRASATQSDQTRWPTEHEQPTGSNEDTRSIASRAQTSIAPRYLGSDAVPEYDSTSSPVPKDKGKSTLASRRHRDSDTEYIYTERIVTPADKPRGWRPKHSKTVEEEVLYMRDDHRRGRSPQ